MITKIIAYIIVILLAGCSLFNKKDSAIESVLDDVDYETIDDSGIVDEYADEFTEEDNATTEEEATETGEQSELENLNKNIDTGIDGRIPYEMDMPSTTRLRSRSDVAKASIQVLITRERLIYKYITYLVF